VPVAETDRVVPTMKSALRHRPVTSETEAPSVPPWTTATKRASRPTQVKRETRTAKDPKPSVNKKKWRKPLRPSHQCVHWMVPAGLGMVLTILAQFALSGAVGLSNDVLYGMPRTTQVDAYVGHEGNQQTKSHFIAENLRGQVVIIEFPGGDAQHVRVLIGPHLSGQDAAQVPVLLSFVDRNGNHQPDLLVQCDSIEVWYLMRDNTWVCQPPNGD